MPLSEGMKAGLILKPYGLQGMVQMSVEPDVKALIQKGDPLFIQIDGQRVPFFLNDLEAVSEDLLLVKFEFIENLDDARAICGNEVFLDPGIGIATQDDTDHYLALEGYQVFNQDGELLGMITGLMTHEHNPLLLIDHQGKELLIPAAGDFILQIDHDNRTVRMNLPEGLTSL